MKTPPPPPPPWAPQLAQPKFTQTALQDFAAQAAAQVAYQAPNERPWQTRPIEAPTRTLTLPQGLKSLVDQLPTTLKHVPKAFLVRCLRIWRDTWADLGTTFTKLLLTRFKNKKGEDRTKQVEYRPWYIEEGRNDELVTYMKQILLDYQGEN